MISRYCRLALLSSPESDENRPKKKKKMMGSDYLANSGRLIISIELELIDSPGSVSLSHSFRSIVRGIAGNRKEAATPPRPPD